MSTVLYVKFCLLEPLIPVVYLLHMGPVRQCSFILQGHAYIRDTPTHEWECPVIATHEWESESGDTPVCCLSSD